MTGRARPRTVGPRTTPSAPLPPRQPEPLLEGPERHRIDSIAANGERARGDLTSDAHRRLVADIDTIRAAMVRGELVAISPELQAAILRVADDADRTRRYVDLAAEPMVKLRRDLSSYGNG